MKEYERILLAGNLSLTSPNVVVAVSAKLTVTDPELPVFVGILPALVDVGVEEDDLAPTWMAKAFRGDTVAVNVPEEETEKLRKK